MIKKKLNILLLLSLALLSLNLLNTTCFAREISTEEICNMIRNFYVNTTPITDNRVPVEEFIEYHLQEGHIQRIAQVTHDLPTQFVLCISYEQLWIWYTWAGNSTGTSNNYKPYIWNSQLNSNTSYMGNAQFRIKFTDKTYWYNVNNQASPSFYNTDTLVYYYSAYNVWNSSPYNQILIQANTYYPNESIFDSLSSFTIDINADFRNNKATISNDTSGTEYYLITYTGDKIRIGNMFDYSNLAGVVKRKFRYKQSIRDFELIQEFESNTNNLDYYSIADDTLVVYEYFQGDTTEFITFIPKEGTGFNEFTIPIYFVTDNTRIVNGVIDGDSTFSGDYYNNYNNDTNTDKVIDNTNNGNDVDSILEETLSGDIDTVSGQLGFSALDNPFTSFLFFVIDGVYDILTQRGNVVLTANYREYLTFTLESDYFITPNGALKTFIRDMLICVYIYGNYKYFHYLITLLETARINKFMAEIGTDEFYDTDIM